MTINVVLVDDQAMVHASFRMILDSHGDIDVVAEASDGDEAMSRGTQAAAFLCARDATVRACTPPVIPAAAAPVNRNYRRVGRQIEPAIDDGRCCGYPASLSEHLELLGAGVRIFSCATCSTSDERPGTTLDAIPTLETMLTEEQRRQFASDGYVVVPSVVDETLLVAADAEIDELVARSPAPAGTVGAHFYFLPPARLPAADAALRESRALDLAGELVASHHLDHALDNIQVALNIPPYPHRPGAPHIDGHRPDEDIASFTMLAAIFLTGDSVPDRGNLWVWPGSHRGHQRLFCERGADVLKAVSGQAILLDPPAWFGPGEPLLAGRGDVLLAHFLLGHNTGGNTSAGTRRILYYRLAAEGHNERWVDTFLDPFTEYPSLRQFAPTEPFVPLPPRPQRS